MPFSQFLGKSIVWIAGALWILVSVVWLTVTSLQVRDILPQETALRQTLLTADEALIELNNQLGFGGFIHNFKNAVLRPAEKQSYLEAFQQNALAIRRSSQQLLTYYPDLGLQIGALLSTVQEYEDKAEFVAQTQLTGPLESDPLVGSVMTTRSRRCWTSFTKVRWPRFSRLPNWTSERRGFTALAPCCCSGSS